MATKTPSIPTTHTAWTFKSRGSPDKVLKLTQTHPTPSSASLKPGEALVKVSGVGLNPAMLLIMAALPHLTGSPWIPEMEYSGTVVALGPASPKQAIEGKEFKVGDRVVGIRDLPTARKYNGAMQAYLVSPLSTLVHLPQSLSMTEAAGLAACGCTALQATNVAGVKRGDKILITGASGGLGTMLVQVARHLVGETGVVVASCSGKNAQLVQSLGADEMIDYTKHEPLDKYLKEHNSKTPFNVIFDLVGKGNSLFTSSPAYLTESGTFVLLGMLSAPSLLATMLRVQLNKHLPSFMGGTPRRFMMYSTSPSAKDIKVLVELMQQGNLKVPIDSVWKSKDAIKVYPTVRNCRDDQTLTGFCKFAHQADAYLQAYEKMASHRARGKIIVEFEECL